MNSDERLERLIDFAARVGKVVDILQFSILNVFNRTPDSLANGR